MKQHLTRRNYEKDKTSQLDVRATVYWQGNVQTDENGKANLSFFAADLPTTYRIVVQGVAEKGQLAGQQHKDIAIVK